MVQIPAIELLEILQSRDGLLIFDSEFEVSHINPLAINFFKKKFELTEELDDVTSIQYLPTEVNKFVSEFLDKAEKATEKSYRANETAGGHFYSVRAFHAIGSDNEAYSVIRIVETDDVADLNLKVEQLQEDVKSEKKTTEIRMKMLVTIGTAISLGVGLFNFIRTESFNEAVEQKYDKSEIYDLIKAMQYAQNQLLKEAEEHEKTADIYQMMFNEEFGEKYNVERVFGKIYERSEKYKQRLDSINEKFDSILFVYRGDGGGYDDYIKHSTQKDHFFTEDTIFVKSVSSTPL